MDDQKDVNDKSFSQVRAYNKEESKQTDLLIQPTNDKEPKGEYTNTKDYDNKDENCYNVQTTESNQIIECDSSSLAARLLYEEEVERLLGLQERLHEICGKDTGYEVRGRQETVRGGQVMKGGSRGAGTYGDGSRTRGASSAGGDRGGCGSQAGGRGGRFGNGGERGGRGSQAGRGDTRGSSEEDNNDYSDEESNYDYCNYGSEEEFTPSSGYYWTGQGDRIYCRQGEGMDLTACDKECGYCGRCRY